MEEIKLWKVGGAPTEKPKAIPVDRVAETTTEQLLEDVLANAPDLLLPNLVLIGRQTETSGGPLDLLGVDEDGHLVIFELKRGTLTREAVAQAIDYSSYLASLEHEQLCHHINENSGKGGTERIDDFNQWYQSHFQRSVADIGKPRIVLVGLYPEADGPGTHRFKALTIAGKTKIESAGGATTRVAPGEAAILRGTRG